MTTQSNNIANAEQAADRYFRCYEAHCLKPNEDTLFNLLNALHSLNDKMQKSCGIDFFAVHEFVALQTLRNLFHHKGELISEIRMATAQDFHLITDLGVLCLVPRNIVEEAIAEIPKKRKAKDEPIVRAVFKWYMNVVNINPCIFNFSVHVFEKCQELGLELTSGGYKMLKNSYEFEVQNGHSHFVTGDISCQVSDVDSMISKIFADVV